MHLTLRELKRFGVWLIIIGVAIYGAWTRQAEILGSVTSNHLLWPSDPDVWVRLTQVRQWLQPGGFFDHTIRNTNAPFGGISIHWTRPLDILLAVFALAAPQALSIDTRLLIAAAYLPPFLGICALFFMTRAAFQLFKHTHVLGCLTVMFIFSPTTYNYFAPGDSDHHGLLCALWAGAIYFTLLPPRLKGRVLLGIFLGLMLWVSPEALLLIAAVYGILGIYAIMRPDEMPYLAWAVLASSAVVTLGLFLEIPAEKILSQITYDALSLAHVTALYLAAAAAILLARVFRRRPTHLRARILCSSLTGISIVLIQYALFPKFFHGPLVDADSFIFTDYLPKVPEAQPLFRNMSGSAYLIVQPVLAAVLLLALLRKDIREKRKRVLIVLGALLLVTFGMTLLQIRFIYYLQPVGMIVIAAIIPPSAVATKGWMRYLARGIRPYVVALAVAGLCILAAAMRFAHTPAPTRQLASDCQAETRFILQTHQLERLLGDKPLILFGPERASGDVLFFTPFRLMTIRFHREGRQMREWQDINEAKSEQTARALLARRRVDALLVCTADAPGGSWLGKISATRHPPWLVPVDSLTLMQEAHQGPMLFRIKGISGGP